MLEHRLIAIIMLLSVYGHVGAQECNPDVSLHSTPTKRFHIPPNANDDYVTDTHTGLQWKRCAEGQRWRVLEGTGQCTQDAEIYNLEDITSKFTNVSPEDFAWHLPSVKELASIVETGCFEPAINLTVFPNTPTAGFWTRSPVHEPNIKSTHFWQVNFTRGSVIKSSNLTKHVRLVRVAPQ